MSSLTWISSQLMRTQLRTCLRTSQKLKSTVLLQLNTPKSSRIFWLLVMFLKSKVSSKNKRMRNNRKSKTKKSKNKNKHNRT